MTYVPRQHSILLFIFTKLSDRSDYLLASFKTSIMRLITPTKEHFCTIKRDERAVVMKVRRIFKSLSLIGLTALILISCSQSPFSFFLNANPRSSTVSGMTVNSSVLKLPATSEPIELTVFAGIDSNLVGIINDYNENAFFKELERRTGVHLKFIITGIEKEQEIYNEMVASGNMADIITHEGNYYPDGWDAAVEDGIYLDLTPYLNTYLKDYNRVRTRDPFVEKSTRTAKGRVVTCNVIYTEPQGPWIGLMVRKDWLDELGLDIPVTFDDWEKMLTLFKTEKNCYAPLSLGQYGYMSLSHALSAGFDVLETFMQVDGKVIYGPITENWKEYLTLLNKWYRKGLIDPNFMINGAWQADKTMIIKGETGAWNAMYTMISEYERSNDEIMVIPVPSPVKKAGDKLHIRREDSIVGNGVAISARCKYPQVAMQLLNYLYTDEGALLANYGIENDTFVYGEDGKPKVTKKISQNPVYSMPQAQALYLIPPSKFGGLYDWTRELSAVPEKDIKALEIWATADDDYILPDKLCFEGQEACERAAIVSAVTTYVNDCTVKFIIGALDINNYWDEYVNTIKRMGIQRAIEITQKSLDRFNGE